MVEERVKEIVKTLLEDITAAEKDIAVAKELIKIGEEAGIDISKERSNLRFLVADIQKYKDALERRLKK